MSEAVPLPIRDLFRDVFAPISNSPTVAARPTATDNVTDDPFWQTEDGIRLKGEMAAVATEQAEAKAREAAGREAALQAQAAEQEKARAARQAQLAAERAQNEEAERIALAARDAEIAAWVEAEAARREEADAIEAAVRKPDGDYHVIRTRLRLTIEEHGLGDVEISSEYGSGGWELLDDDEASGALNAAIPDIIDAIKPWTGHYGTDGSVRADDDGEPIFYRITRPDAAGLSTATLGEFPDVRLQIPSLPGMTIVLRADTKPVNATALYGWMREWDGSTYQGWGGPDTPELRLRDGESRGAWLKRVCTPTPCIARAVERWVASGRCPAIYRHFGDISERVNGDRDVEFIADKRIPRGFLTFLVGDSGIGKSSLVHEWIAAFSGVANGRPTTVLGAEVPGRLVCALISAEDGPARINQRARDHAKIWDRCTYLTSPDPLRDLDHHLAQLRQLPNLDLVVFDPLVSFLDDNEDLAHIARPFCNKLTQFAADMNCAVVLVHHIRKGKQPPRTLAEVFDRMRGSSDFKAAARMVICMLKRRDGIVVIGPCKHNFADRDVWLPKFQGDEYRVDDETSTLVPLNAEVGGPDDLDGPDAAAEVEMRVLATVRRCNSSGVIVLRSGKAGLFESRPQELTGISRAAILAAVDNLVTAGQLIGGGRAGLHLPAPSAADEGSATDE